MTPCHWVNSGDGSRIASLVSSAMCGLKMSFGPDTDDERYSSLKASLGEKLVLPTFQLDALVLLRVIGVSEGIRRVCRDFNILLFQSRPTLLHSTLRSKTPPYEEAGECHLRCTMHLWKDVYR